MILIHSRWDSGICKMCGLAVLYSKLFYQKESTSVLKQVSAGLCLVSREHSKQCWPWPWLLLSFAVCWGGSLLLLTVQSVRSPTGCFLSLRGHSASCGKLPLLQFLWDMRTPDPQWILGWEILSSYRWKVLHSNSSQHNILFVLYLSVQLCRLSHSSLLSVYFLFVYAHYITIIMLCNGVLLSICFYFCLP